MGALDVFMATVTPTDPTLRADQPKISDFLTAQSLANFAAMTGALSAAWLGLQQIWPDGAKGKWVPYAGALVWAIISFLMSFGGLRELIKDKDFITAVGIILGTIFVAFLNALVLGSAVVGAQVVARITS